MNVFECWHEGVSGEQWAKHQYIATTAGKAKYAHFIYLQDGLFEADFLTVVRNMKCEKIGKASVSTLFGNSEQFERMKTQRNISFAFQGMHIEVCGKKGTIVGSNHCLNLNVVYDGKWITNNCHPWYETVYYDNNGNIVADYREKKSCNKY